MPLHFFLLALAVAAPPAADGAKPPDYQALADRALWSWFAQASTAKHCAERLPKPYQARVEPGGDAGGQTTITVGDGVEDFHTFAGHGETVFAIHDGVLFYTDHHPNSSGCAVVAFDLRAEKQLWKTQLTGLGPIAHSKYRNRVNIAADGKVVRVYGLESAGGYVEFVDRKSGKTVGSRKFSNDETAASR